MDQEKDKENNQGELGKGPESRTHKEQVPNGTRERESGVKLLAT